MNLFVRSNSLRAHFSKQTLPVLSSLTHRAGLLHGSCIHKLIPQLSCVIVQQRHQHKPSNVGLELPIWQRIKWNMGFYGKLQVPDRMLNQAGYNLYVCCTDFINFAEFVKVLNIPDTFNSWFLLLQLHLWMVNVKVSQMGKEGAILKTYVYRAMWINVEERLKKFKDLGVSERKEALVSYHSLMLLAIMYYDEGLIGSDKLLANALWAHLFTMNPNIEADKLELMVKYIRKQVHHHDSLNPDIIMHPGYISFMPLLDDKLDDKKSLDQLQYLSDTKGV